jgi:hypothetical protein
MDSDFAVKLKSSWVVPRWGATRKAKQARASKASVLVASAASQEEASIDHVGVTASPLHAATEHAAVGVAASPLNAATPLSMMQP